MKVSVLNPFVEAIWLTYDTVHKIGLPLNIDPKNRFLPKSFATFFFKWSISY